jgi:hypothetical protein
MDDQTADQPHTCPVFMSMSTMVCRPSLTSLELRGLQRTTTRMHSSAGSLGTKGSAMTRALVSRLWLGAGAAESGAEGD